MDDFYFAIVTILDYSAAGAADGSLDYYCGADVDDVDVDDDDDDELEVCGCRYF